MARERHPFETRRIRWERNELADYASYTLTATVGRPGSSLAREYSVSVSAVSDLLAARELGATSRAHLVVAKLEWDAIREYVSRLVANCPEMPDREAHETFERYFDAHVTSAATPRSGGRSRVEIRGFDPPWFESPRHDAFTMTFGVAERGDPVDTELSVAVVTPTGLAARATEGSYVLCHRATILVPSIDLDWVHRHIAAIVTDECSAPDLAIALPLLQRYFRIPWEVSLSRRLLRW
jgi:hypothetical protein